MQSVLDDVRKSLLEKPRLELAAKGICYNTVNAISTREKAKYSKRPESAVRLFRLRRSNTKPGDGQIADFRRVAVQNFVRFAILTYNAI